MEGTTSKARGTQTIDDNVREGDNVEIAVLRARGQVGHRAAAEAQS